MNMRTRFITLFSLAILTVAAIVSTAALVYLREAFGIFSHTANADLIPVMAHRMFLKSAFGFCAVALGVIAVSIPFGLYLSKLATRPYLRVFENMSDLARRRLDLEQRFDLPESEIAILEKYLRLMLADLRKIKDFEKEQEWKKGARMLLHELKNPLTPLKLSAQRLSLASGASATVRDETGRILSSVSDIEKILSMFKEMVNIEFGPKQEFDLREFIASVAADEEWRNRGVAIGASFASDVFPIQSEPTLLRIVFNNLIRNGMEANAEKFSCRATELGDGIARVEFITRDVRLADESRLFRLGFSTKGKQRGFGLFLCKKISDYLDLDLRFSTVEAGIIFSLTCKRFAESGAGEPPRSSSPAA